MKIYISVDGEGASGVVTAGEMYPGKPGYEFGRKMMTLDVNAAVEGAFEGGATEVVVNDSHWHMNNIDMELLDPRADLIRGGNKHLGMVEAIHEGFDGAFFIGYHARAGASDGVGNETVWGREVIEMRMNGKPVGEAEMNAAVAGFYGVPVIMVSGDNCFCEEIRQTLPMVEVAPVKYALNRFSARCLSLEKAHKLIREKAASAVHEITRHQPYKVEGPIELETEFMSTAEASTASMMPGSVRKSLRTVAFTGKDPVEAWKGVFSTQLIGCTASDDIYG
ncbi:MAG: M55 family metallopeptidase [Anaerolineaceae bacterium]|nr:M55 family metallopeptidase [Anaerolineaceae bacterium]